LYFPKQREAAVRFSFTAAASIRVQHEKTKLTDAVVSSRTL
jgi:hypothetical protein